jgi:hypothetical protein
MREFKIDITLAADMAQFLEALLEAEFNEEFDAEEACTDTFLDQFMPNGFVPNADLIAAIKASGIVTAIPPVDLEPCKHAQTYVAVRHTAAGGMAIYKCKNCNKVV